MTNTVMRLSEPPKSVSATDNIQAQQDFALAVRKVEDAIKAPSLMSIAGHNGVGATGGAVTSIITSAMGYWAPARRLDASQVPVLAEVILSDYPHETLADIALFMRGAAMSKYDDGEYYGSMDIPRMMKWWAKYLEEKAEARERDHVRAEALQDKEIRDGLSKLGVNVKSLVKAVGDLPDELQNRSKLEDRIRRMVPLMDDERLRQAYIENKSAWARAIILREATHRGLMDKYLNQTTNTDGK